MNSPNFGTILDKPASEIERHKPLPQRSYVCVIKGLPRYDKSTKKQTEFAEFILQPLQAMDDVDEEALKAFFLREDGTSRTLADVQTKLTFYLTENSVYRLKDFLIDDLGIEEQESLRPMMDQTPGCQCVMHIKHTTSEDGKSIYANVSSTAPVE